MAIWDDKKLFDRLMDLLSQREKGYVKFNMARDNIAVYCRPDLGSDVNPEGDGSFFGQDIYDGVASWAPGVMARGFQGKLVSPTTDWLDYAMSQSELKENDRLDIWLQDVKEHNSAVYQKSNLYEVLPTFTLDGVTIGSPVMFIDEEVVTGTIKFTPQHYKTVILFYDKWNQPEGIIVKDETWTAKQISDRFARSEDDQKIKLSTAVNNNIQNGNYYKEHTVYRCVFKGDHPVWDLADFKKPSTKWISVYFEEKPKEERKNIPLMTEGYFTRPFAVWDIDKKPWENSSRTPAFSAIYDIIGQQQQTKEQLENMKLKNRGPRQVLEDYRNAVNFGPEGITYVSKEDWNFPPKMIDVIGDIRLSREELEAGEAKIKRWFHTEQFLKFTDLTNTLRQQPSVDQNHRIAAELAVQLNPAIGTYTGGALRSIDDRVIDIESRAGRGPFAPAIMEEIEEIVLANATEPVKSIGVVPVFIGPLAREQRTQQELDPILTGLSAATPLFETFPDLKNAIREYDTLEDILKAIGFPLKDLKPEDEYDEIIEQINTARAQQQQQQLALEVAKATESVSGPVDETSILAGVAG